MKKILVISDTHGLSESRVRDVISLEKPDIKVHCGDHMYDPKIMDELFTYYVDGNNDFKKLENHQIIEFECEGFRFMLMHGHQIIRRKHFIWLKQLHDLLRKTKNDVLLFGHSHRYEVKYFPDQLVLANPGSIALPYNSIATYMIIKVNNNQIEFVKKIYDKN